MMQMHYKKGTRNRNRPLKRGKASKSRRKRNTETRSSFHEELDLSLRKRTLNPATHVEISVPEQKSRPSTADNKNIEAAFDKETCNSLVKIKEEETSNDEETSEMKTPRIVAVYGKNSFYTEFSPSNNIPFMDLNTFTHVTDTSQMSHSSQITSNVHSSANLAPSTNFTCSLQNSKKTRTCDKRTESNNQSNLFFEEDILKEVLNHLNNCATEDKFDIAGKLCAAKLRLISKVQQQCAKVLIGDILLAAELKHLDHTTILSNTFDLNSPRRQKPDFASDAYLKKQNMDIPNLTKLNISRSEKFCLDSNINRIMMDIRGGLLRCAYQDTFDVIGKLYAKKMRSFLYDQYLYAENLINQVLHKAEFGFLDNTFVLSKSIVPSTKCSRTTYSEIIEKSNTFSVGKEVPKAPKKGVPKAKNGPKAKNRPKAKKETLKAKKGALKAKKGAPKAKKGAPKAKKGALKAKKEAPKALSLIQNHSEKDVLSDTSNECPFKSLVMSANLLFKQKSSCKYLTSPTLLHQTKEKQVSFSNSIKDTPMLTNSPVVKPNTSFIKSKKEKQLSISYSMEETAMLTNSYSPKLPVLKPKTSFITSFASTPVVPYSSICILPVSYPALSSPPLTVQFPLQPMAIIT